jgi:hypothetical protein
LDVFSLLAGLVVIAFAALFIVGQYTTLELDGRLVVPLLLVGLGLAGLAGALVAQRRSDHRLAAGSSSGDAADA